MFLQMEEDRLLSGGRTKVVGLKSRLELAWQKEREDQQRLLQETSTLARDLRQTLFEVGKKAHISYPLSAKNLYIAL